MKRILSFSLFIGFMLFRFASVADAQGKMRAIKDVPLHENSPIVVVSRELGNKTFDSRRPVLGDRDWLKQLTLDVKNISNKNVVYFNIDLVIPKQGKMPGSMGLAIFFGSWRGPYLTHPGDPKIKEKLLRPGDVVKVKVSDNEFLHWIKKLEEYEVEDVTFITMDIRTVYFDDGTGWQMGIELQQDPDNPKVWSLRPSLNQ